MRQVFRVSLVGLALIGVIGVDSKPTSAWHANGCATQWAYWWKHGHCHVTYPPH